MYNPLNQVHMDSFSSSVTSIERYVHAIEFVGDACIRYRWIQGIKNKDDTLNLLKRWFIDIVDLRAMHKLVVVMRDNASENKSEEIMHFLDSKGITSHFSTPKAQRHNEAADSTINSIMMIARTVMAESGLGGRFCSRLPQQAKMPAKQHSRRAQE